MAGGALNLTLDDYISAKLVEKAKAMGVTPERLATDLLQQTLDDDGVFGVRQSDRVSNHDLNEEGRIWSEVRPELLARMKQKIADRT